MIWQTKIVLLVALILLSAFFSGAEIALFSLSRLRTKLLVKAKNKGAKAVEKLKSNPQRLLVIILIGNNLVNVGASVLATTIMYDLGLNYAFSITTGVLTLILLIFGEITPKSLAIKHNEEMSLFVARPLLILQTIFWPIVVLFEAMANAMSPATKKPLVTEEEIKAFVEIGEEVGTIKESEKRMIHSIFKFDDLTAKDIMLAKSKIVGIESYKNIEEAALIFDKKNRTKMPVFEKNLNEIKGFVHIFDLHKAILEGKNHLKITSIMKAMTFVPETKDLYSLLLMFQDKGRHIAIVHNKAGKTIGLVTLEDVLEEIVGEIMEEHEKSLPLIKKLSEEKPKK